MQYLEHTHHYFMFHRKSTGSTSPSISKALQSHNYVQKERKTPQRAGTYHSQTTWRGEERDLGSGPEVEAERAERWCCQAFPALRRRRVHWKAKEELRWARQRQTSSKRMRSHVTWKVSHVDNTRSGRSRLRLNQSSIRQDYKALAFTSGIRHVTILTGNSL